MKHRDLPPVYYYLGFNLTSGIGPARVAHLVQYFGSIQAAWQAAEEQLLQAGLDPKSCSALLATRNRVSLRTEMEKVVAVGAEAVCVEDADYPRLLREIAQPPPLIYFRGTLAATDEWALAIVGTRQPTIYGKEATRRIVGQLASAGVTIVSGLALGIDALAHQMTLEVGGRTLAVLGSGVDQIYPERNRSLAEQIMRHGALISEYPLGTPPAPLNFPPRNRLISGLALGTVVIEAGERSGALITTQFAAEQGREVFAVPGTILSETSIGTNRLIRGGATLITGANDLLEALSWTVAPIQQELRLEVAEDPTEGALMNVLSFDPQHIDELGIRCGLDAATVAATLMTLELRGMVRQAGTQLYVRTR